jgi:outer membrane protein TolC
LKITSQIALDYGAAQAARRILSSARREAREVRQVYVMTRKGYFDGALNGLDLAQAESSWVRTRLRFADAENAVQLPRAQLELDVGRYPDAHTRE